MQLTFLFNAHAAYALVFLQQRGGSTVAMYRNPAVKTALEQAANERLTAATFVMLSSALAFLDLSPTDVGGGFWTPATAFGDVLIDRLVEHAGLTFDVVNPE